MKGMKGRDENYTHGYEDSRKKLNNSKLRYYDHCEACISS